MAKASDPNLYRTEADFVPDDSTPEYTLSPVQIVVAKPFAFDDIANIWRKVRGDGAGRLRTTAGVPISTTLVPTNIVIPGSTTQQLIVDSNPKRNLVIIDHQGTAMLQMAFRTGDIAAGNFIDVPNDSYLYFDGYQGQIWMGTNSLANQFLKVILA